MQRFRKNIRGFWPGLLALAALASAGDLQPPVDYNRQIRPLLSENCYVCHGPDQGQRKAGLRLDLEAGALGPLKSGGRAVVRGDVEKSVLVARVSSRDEDEVMPPPKTGKKLTAAQVDLLRRWVAEGAVWQKHWSLVPPTRPPVPEVRRKDWPRNPIDHFILARLEQEGLEPSLEAAKETLLRRVSYDLTGLPPSLEELDDFLADESPQAYERVVDRLLRSPHYGERMAVHWLDLARYADTHGFHLDSGREMWKWREWVIEAFNDNLPFDRFTLEQVAGDLLPGATRSQTLATGFNRNHMINFEGGAIPEEYLTHYVVDRVVTTSTVYLGLTMGCAQCHDHKYDPLSMRDFYRLYAYFNAVPENGLDGSRGNAEPVLALPSAGQERELAQLQDRLKRAERRLEERLPEVDAAQSAWEEEAEGSPERFWDVLLPWEVAEALALAPQMRSPKHRDRLRNYYREQVSEVYRTAQHEVAHEKQAIEELQRRIPTSMVMRQMDKPRDTFILVRGQYDQRGEKVDPGTPASLPPLPPDAPPTRLGLARWLIDPEHPLVGRVTVNRFWEMTMGTGLVKTANDFGSQGEWPSHAELLDWLAREFVDSGWDVKRILKLLVTSATYRQSATVRDVHRARDPYNRLYARGPRFRLSAEQVRDTSLAVSGLLVRTIGGPSVSPYQPEGLWQELSSRKDSGNWTAQKYVPSHGPDLYRRSLYTFWKRTCPPPALATFDAPDRETCVVVRERTSTPLQALVLLNDPTHVESARLLAQRMMTEAGPDEAARISLAFRLATARRPDAREIDLLRALYQRQRARFAAEPEQARALLTVGEFPCNPALEPADLAAWTMVASTILNLDETVNKG